MRVFRRSGAPCKDMLRAYKFFILPKVEYALVPFLRLFTKRQLHQIENLQRKATRIILASSTTRYNERLWLLNLEFIADRAERALIKFARKGIISGWVDRVLCAAEKPERTRSGARFIVPLRRTVKCSNSPLDVIAKLLNEMETAK